MRGGTRCLLVLLAGAVRLGRPRALVFLATRGFSPDGPLVLHRLAHLVPDLNHVHPPMLGHYRKPDAQVLNLLLCQAALDARLAGKAEVTTPEVSIVN